MDSLGQSIETYVKAVGTYMYSAADCRVLVVLLSELWGTVRNNSEFYR
jgi:hypothetical protein